MTSASWQPASAGSHCRRSFSPLADNFYQLIQRQRLEQGASRFDTVAPSARSRCASTPPGPFSQSWEKGS